MKYPIAVRLMVLFLFVTVLAQAQNKPGNACYINNNRIYFTLDKRWNTAERKEFSVAFSIDSVVVARVLNGETTVVFDSITWLAGSINEFEVEMSKPIASDNETYTGNDVFLLDEHLMVNPFSLIPEFNWNRRYGVNKFGKTQSVTYSGDTARFLLSGYKKAVRVYLSGTFNNWSTMQLPMIQTSSGWVASVRLIPGRYLYKFIIDGRWEHDLNNQLKEDDENGGFNSVLYCYNYTFRLNGYSSAKKVFVSGSFNNWAERRLRMKPVKGGWELALYLDEGTHAYKYIVDNEWINDPENKVIRTDAFGNKNSFLGIGDTLVFKLKGFTNASNVVLAGSFNAWSPTELVMNKTDYGWELPYVLGAGNYEYKYIVDGSWMTDPDNPVQTGEGDYANSCITFKPNHVFELSQFVDAHEVIVTGSFNQWREDSFKMYKSGGKWVYPLSLRPGKYTYKFIVDGTWTIDPANELWEGNDEGTGNSVLWIDP